MFTTSGRNAAVATTALILGTGAMLGSAGAATLPIALPKNVPVVSLAKPTPIKTASIAAPLAPGKLLPAPIRPASRVPIVPVATLAPGKAPAPTLAAAKPPLVPAIAGPAPKIPTVQIGAAATSRTYQIGLNGQVDTATEVTIEPTAKTKGSITTIIRSPSGQVVKTSTTVCPIGWACGQAPTSAVLAANPSWAVPAQSAPVQAPAAPNPPGISPGIVAQANAIGVTPAQLLVLINGPRNPGDPKVINIPKQTIAGSSGVVCAHGVTASYGGAIPTITGTLANGNRYVGPAGSAGGWVYTCT